MSIAIFVFCCSDNIGAIVSCKNCRLCCNIKILILPYSIRDALLVKLKTMFYPMTLDCINLEIVSCFDFYRSTIINVIDISGISVILSFRNNIHWNF